MGSDKLVLSVLICSLIERRRLLDELTRKLRNIAPDINELGEIEILTQIDDGQMPVGAKRNLLLEKARGRYVCFVDDDDDVVDTYLIQILKAAREDSDCIGITGRIIRKMGTYRFMHSISFCGWYTSPVDLTFYRTPNHLNPVKRELALAARFPRIDYGEDILYSNRLKPRLKTETMIKDPIYIYYEDRSQRTGVQNES